MKVCTRLIAVILLFVVASCGKKKNDQPSSSSFVLTLDTPSVSGKKIMLKWSGIESRYISSIYMERSIDTGLNKPPQLLPVTAADSQYTDTLTLNSYVAYRVRAQVLVNGISKTIYSNTRVFARSDIDFLPFVPKDAICDKQTGRIYMISAIGELAVYDITTRKVLRKIETGATIMSMLMATHNGKKEIYLSRNDGWVFMYDPETLDKTDQINTEVVPAGIVYANGKLFISSSYSSPAFLTYDRTTKALLFDTTYSFSNLSLMVLPGTNTDLLGLSSTRYRMSFDANGVMKWAKNSFSSSYSVAPPYALLPGDNRIVCANTGIIFDTGFNYLSTLPRGSVFLKSFDVDADNAKLYCGTSGQEVHVYNTSTYMQEKRIITQGLPVKVIYYNGGVYCISTESYYSGSGAGSFVERF